MMLPFICIAKSSSELHFKNTIKQKYKHRTVGASLSTPSIQQAPLILQILLQCILIDDRVRTPRGLASFQSNRHEIPDRK